MNKLIILIVLKIVASEKVQLMSSFIPHKEDNYLHSINDKLQNVVNEIFTSLALNKTVAEGNDIKVLLIMHDNVRLLMEHNYELYKDIERSSKSDCDNKNALFNLTIVVDSIMANDSVGLNFDNATAKELDTRGPFLTEFLDTVKNTSFYYPNRLNTTLNRTRSLKKTGLKFWKSFNFSHVQNNRRIFGAEQAEIRRFPFVVSFHIAGDFMCSGSIISKNHVITSASCLQMQEAYNDARYLANQRTLTIRAGSDYTKSGGIVLIVQDINFHPSYDPMFLTSNLAIAKMMNHLQFKANDNRIRRIDYDTEKRETNESVLVAMVGWGDQDQYGTEYKGPIAYTILPIYILELCKEVYSDKYVHDTNFCVGYSNQRTGACNRDVGGPGIIGDKLVGVVSFGPPICGTAGAPTVFTKLGFFADWIDSVIAPAVNTVPPQIPAKLAKNQTIKRFNRKSAKSKSANFRTDEEVQTLKKLFKELVLRGDVDVESLFYDDDSLEMNNNFWSKTTTTRTNLRINDSPMFNGSFFLLEGSGVYKPGQNQKTTSITTPGNQFMQNLGVDSEFVEMIDNIQKLLDPLLKDNSAVRHPTSIPPTEKVTPKIQDASLDLINEAAKALFSKKDVLKLPDVVGLTNGDEKTERILKYTAEQTNISDVKADSREINKNTFLNSEMQTKNHKNQSNKLKESFNSLNDFDILEDKEASKQNTGRPVQTTTKELTQNPKTTTKSYSDELENFNKLNKNEESDNYYSDSKESGSNSKNSREESNDDDEGTSGSDMGLSIDEEKKQYRGTTPLERARQYMRVQKQRRISTTTSSRHKQRKYKYRFNKINRNRLVHSKEAVIVRRTTATIKLPPFDMNVDVMKDESRSYQKLHDISQDELTDASSHYSNERKSAHVNIKS